MCPSRDLGRVADGYDQAFTRPAQGLERRCAPWTESDVRARRDHDQVGVPTAALRDQGDPRAEPEPDPGDIGDRLRISPGLIDESRAALGRQRESGEMVSTSRVLGDGP